MIPNSNKLVSGSKKAVSAAETYLQRIVEGKELDIKELNRLMSELSGMIDEIKEKKQIVFIPYKAKYWNSMESIWKAAAADALRGMRQKRNWGRNRRI